MSPANNLQLVPEEAAQPWGCPVAQRLGQMERSKSTRKREPGKKKKEARDIERKTVRPWYETKDKMDLNTG
jgi:hypothetical protein